jgi:hypothetical protein
MPSPLLSSDCSMSTISSCAIAMGPRLREHKKSPHSSLSFPSPPPPPLCCRLNSYWQGADWTLAERYTDVLKTIFVGLFFLVPLPSGLFITAFAMITTYLVDKYSLLRLWKRPPQFDKTLGQFSRYFYIGIVFCHLSISRVYFANWPYSGLWGQDTSQRARCTFFKCYLNE